MKSKIPHPKTAFNDEKARASRNRATNDPILIQDALILLGAPHIEREEFGRVFHGPLADVLVFLSEHIRGRKEVALARHRIHQWVDQKSTRRNELMIRDYEGCARRVWNHIWSNLIILHALQRTKPRLSSQEQRKMSKYWRNNWMIDRLRWTNLVMAKQHILNPLIWTRNSLQKIP